MAVQIRLVGPVDELHAVREQLHAALGRSSVHIDSTRPAGDGRERWYGEIDVPSAPRIETSGR